MEKFLRFTLAAVLATPAAAGPFSPAANQPGSDAIAAADSRFTTWATSAVVERGMVEIGFPESSEVSFGADEDATGPADANPDAPYPVVSLGDGGKATLQFSQPFGDAPGPDLAVFENGFVSSFLELAHVEVSSDGVNFFRFPSTSLTPASVNIGEGGAVDPTDVHNLAGKYLAGFGTPFDLAELRHVSPLLDIQRVTHVRVIDTVGTNDPAFASRDSSGNIVIDPYPTPYFTGGFDLDAVGAFTLTSTTYVAWKTAQGITGNDPSADGNQNGTADFAEYMTGSGRILLSGSQLRFNRLSYRTDGDLWIEGSADLVGWTPLARSLHGATISAVAPGVSASESGAASKQVTVTLPSNAPWRFFRLAAKP